MQTAHAHMHTVFKHLSMKSCLVQFLGSSLCLGFAALSNTTQTMLARFSIKNCARFQVEDRS